MDGCLVSAVARVIGSGCVVIRAVIVGNVVSRVIITRTVMLGAVMLVAAVSKSIKSGVV